jgi:aminomethyltransferase
MKTTAFTQKHIELGAKMVPFAGFNMPLEYIGIKAEHLAVRNSVGVFDVSHMGEFYVKGPNALKFVQYVTSNDAFVLFPGKIQYSCFPNGKGGIVDDLVVYCFDPQCYMMVVNAANMQKDCSKVWA